MTSAISINIFLSMFFSGILVPGGFGKRGTEGKIAAAAWGRKMKKPYLGTVSDGLLGVSCDAFHLFCM